MPLISSQDENLLNEAILHDVIIEESTAEIRENNAFTNLSANSQDSIESGFILSNSNNSKTGDNENKSALEEEIQNATTEGLDHREEGTPLKKKTKYEYRITREEKLKIKNYEYTERLIMA
ncbi:hypothetical protein ILUMI_25175 [Ignelater luminosus]|uniref:Uncharacterized protein n=1 Tax=Ignelater luminosus TaxID=2038154 RepID=A0A8K0CAH0_IGNLU|nr:hypothetical protein ILUMI_25175 [Ignelater luminosus]